MSGVGRMPAGSGPYGSGTPLEVPEPGGRIFIDHAGGQQGSRYINPTSGDFEFDEFGRPVGMMNVRQLVQLRVACDRGSASMLALGQDMKSIQRITDNVSKQIDNELSVALGDLTGNGVITVNSIKAERIVGVPAGVFVRLKWTDTTTGETFEEKIQ